MKHGYSTTLYRNGKVEFGHVMFVSPKLKSYRTTTDHYVFYFDVFESKEEAEQWREAEMSMKEMRDGIKTYHNKRRP